MYRNNNNSGRNKEDRSEHRSSYNNRPPKPEPEKHYKPVEEGKIFDMGRVSDLAFGRLPTPREEEDEFLSNGPYKPKQSKQVLDNLNAKLDSDSFNNADEFTKAKVKQEAMRVYGALGGVENFADLPEEKKKKIEKSGAAYFGDKFKDIYDLETEAVVKSLKNNEIPLESLTNAELSSLKPYYDILRDRHGKATDDPGFMKDTLDFLLNREEDSPYKGAVDSLAKEAQKRTGQSAKGAFFDEFVESFVPFVGESVMGEGKEMEDLQQMAHPTANKIGEIGGVTTAIGAETALLFTGVGTGFAGASLAGRLTRLGMTMFGEGLIGVAHMDKAPGLLTSLAGKEDSALLNFAEATLMSGLFSIPFKAAKTLTGGEAKAALRKVSTDTLKLPPVVEDLISKNYKIKSSRVLEKDLLVQPELVKNAENVIARNINKTANSFRPSGKMSRELFDVVDESKNIVHAHMNKADRSIQQLRRVIGDKADPELLNRMNLALKGDASALGTLKPEVSTILKDMRSHIDDLSKDMTKKGYLNDDLNLVLNDNLGSYVHRSYRAHDFSNWRDTLTPDVIDGAKGDLVKMFPNKSNEAIDSILSDILDETKRSSPIMSKNSMKNILRKRQDLGPNLRKALGEYDDPFVNYSKTIGKLAQLTEHTRLRKSVLDNGLKFGKISKVAKPGMDVPVPIKMAKKNVLPEYQKLYTSRDVADILQEIETPTDGFFKSADPIVDMYYKLYLPFKAGTQYTKTILNHETHLKNIYGNLLIDGANGRLSTSNLSKGFKIALTDAFGEGNVTKKMGNLMDEMHKRGLLDDTSVSLGLIKDQINKSSDALSSGFFNGSGAGIIGDVKNLYSKTLKKGLEPISKLYQAEDAAAKMGAFLSEINRYAGKYSGEELLNKATDIVKLTTPNYSRLPQVVKTLARSPLGNFTAFPAEMLRVTYNTIELGLQELKDPLLRATGIKRLAGSIATPAALLIPSKLTKNYFGITDKEEESIRIGQPSWEKNSPQYYFSPVKDGKYSYVNLGSANPFDIITTPLDIIYKSLSGGPSEIVNGLFDALKDLTGKFLEPSIATQSLRETLNLFTGNPSKYGNPNDTITNKIIDSFLGTLSEFTPGTATSIERLVDAETTGKSKSGFPRDSVSSRLKLLTSFNHQTVDRRQLGEFKFRQLQRELRSRSQGFYSEMNRQDRNDPNRLNDIYKDTIEKRAAVFDKIYTEIEAMKQLGISKRDIYKAMKNAGISKTDRNSIWLGKTPKFRISTENLRDLRRTGKGLDVHTMTQSQKYIRERPLKYLGE